MSKITVRKVNIYDINDRKISSLKLQDMEKEFSYPLGEKTFFIKHGFNSENYDYFSYFEQLGQPYFYLIEKDNNAIGCICFVLRNIENKKTWYICDLKIIKEQQSKKITFMLYNLLKNELSSITSSFYFVNMSPVKNNALFKIACKVLTGFDMEIQLLYIYEVDKNHHFLKNKCIGSNKYKKDIVIDNKSVPLYHAINNIEDRTANIELFDLQEIEEDSIVMFCSYTEIEHLKPSAIGILGKSNMQEIDNFSTFEI